MISPLRFLRTVTAMVCRRAADDYDPTNPDSGLIEDLDDNDGNSDADEEADGTNPTNPDTDGDGMVMVQLLHHRTV